MSRPSVLSARGWRRGPTAAAPASTPTDESRGGILSDLERLLKDPGCPACAYVAEGERSFFSWFVIETSTAIEVQARLRAGLGMCPAHSRLLVEEIGAGPVMTRVMRQALAGARERLGGEAPGPCPACDASGSASERACQLLVDGLRDPAKARSYREHRGMCLPHVLQAAASAEHPVIQLACERLLASLEDLGQSGLALLAGADRDASRRARWRDHLPTHPTDTTIDALCARVAIETCPVCLSSGHMDRSYVRWLAERNREHDQSVVRDPGELCSTHLHDLYLADLDAGAEAMRRKRAGRVGMLTTLIERLGRLSPPSRGRHTSEDRLRSALEEFTFVPHCPACHAREAIEHSQLDLIGAALSLSAVRDRYEGGHGLCVRHAMQLGDTHPAHVARRHLDARLAVLAWEVDENARKYAWAPRHEPLGPERDAWLRGLVQIDGRVFEGAPPPAGTDQPLPQHA